MTDQSEQNLNILNYNFNRDCLTIHKSLPFSYPQTLGFKVQNLYFIAKWKSLGIHAGFLERHPAVCLTGFRILHVAHNICALAIEGPSDFDVTTVLPCTLSPAVLSYSDNLFTFESLSLQGTNPAAAGPGNFYKHIHFVYMTYFGHPLASLDSPFSLG